jgi:lipid-A-disaccharide synthase
MTREILIVAGEASGDLHGARLVRAMLARNQDLHFSGIGGMELEKAGVELLYDAAKIAVVGLFEVVSHLGHILAARKKVVQRLAERKPALLILIDFPDFNLLLARQAKRLEIPVFYYISPQVWAWRSGRVKTIGNLVDKIGVILPFEEDFYRNRGVEAHYVGHPLLDSVKGERNREQFCRDTGIDPSRKLIGILPGSRVKEVRNLLPIFLDAALRFSRQSTENTQLLIPLAPTLTERDLLDNGLAPYLDELDIEIVPDNRYDVMSACDIVVAASGTVTLELMLLDTPMVVAYRLSRLTYMLGKFIVKGEYFSLVNLIGDKPIVPELLQDEANAEQISLEMERLVYDERAIRKVREGFGFVRERLGEPGASDRAADLALSVMEES